MSTSDEGVVTSWIESLKRGDLEAAQPLWDHYFERIVRLARDMLDSLPRPGGGADEEDAALSAFVSLFSGIQKGRFPRLADRDDLWRLLVTITHRKAIDQVEHGRRLKRGGGRVVSGSALAGLGGAGDGLEWVESHEPSHEFVAMLADEVRSRIAGLPDETTRRVATLRIEGYTIEEIAERLDCVPRTAARKLALIRQSWSPRVEP